jgi:hypothetical protein
MDLKISGTKRLAFIAHPFGTAIEVIDGAQVGDGV